MKPSTVDAYKLLLDGSAALTNVEHNGMRIDVKYLDRMIEQTAIKTKQMESKLKEDEVYKTWRKTYGEKSDLGSRKQLGNVIFNILGDESKNNTKAGNPKTNVEALQEVDFPFVKKWNNFESLKRLRATNLIGVRRATVDGILHPFFHLHLAITYRPSSSEPNFQNLPHRDPRQAKLVRRAFVPRNKNFVLVELDYKSIEVRIAACHHKDPTMLEYINNDYDLHLDMAAELYLLDTSQVTPPIRQMGKGGFVFPSFYGDWYQSICKELWTAIDQEKLTTKDGVSVRDHLTNLGMTELGDLNQNHESGYIPRPGTFEAHVRDVENRFWFERFSVYDKWKTSWYEEYLRHGYYRMKTGFISQGVFKKNEVINGPIQGTSFHCLLWSLIKINNWLVENKMKTMVIGNIHDSIELDVFKDELDKVLEVCDRIMTEEIKKEWPWIIVPLAVECKIGEKNWFEMKEMAI